MEGAVALKKFCGRVGHCLSERGVCLAFRSRHWQEGRKGKERKGKGEGEEGERLGEEIDAERLLVEILADTTLGKRCDCALQ